MNNYSISARLPELTITQINQLKDFYEKDSIKDACMWRPSTARIIIICVNAFWKKIFEEQHELSDIANEILNK